MPPTVVVGKQTKWEIDRVVCGDWLSTLTDVLDTKH
jgi:hypothetical protein